MAKRFVSKVSFQQNYNSKVHLKKRIIRVTLRKNDLVFPLFKTAYPKDLNISQAQGIPTKVLEYTDLYFQPLVMHLHIQHIICNMLKKTIPIFSIIKPLACKYSKYLPFQ